MRKVIMGFLLVIVAVAVMATVPSSPDRRDTFAAMGGQVVTKADADITYGSTAIWPRGIIVGDTGQVTLTTMDGSTIVFTDGELLEGILYPICVRRISSTGTNATKFVVVW